ncbi:ATP-binding protein, partial [Sphingomonas sp.]|uniref:ATP-binding protein n=1 Tax=Sphingomonas sp. TaxID=28214 RepID=UPI002869F24A
MNDQPNLKQFLDEMGSFTEQDGAASRSAASGKALPPIGHVVEIAGSGSQVRLDPAVLNTLSSHADLSVAMSGQVGSQVKMNVGSSWLIANVRTMRADDTSDIVAHVDFLGEGNRDSAGKLSNFRRGVTKFPIPGAQVHPVTSDDLRSVFAADDRAHIEIGTVYPTDDIRGALYIDPMLSKHFAVVGSTGTGKSTAVALILHRISELSPEGHIVMIDPHGEYSAAFKGCGELFNVENLQLPYWLMNFEEHCEVLLTTQGAERERDSDILAKLLLAARTKGKNMEQLG